MKTFLCIILNDLEKVDRNMCSNPHPMWMISWYDLMYVGDLQNECVVGDFLREPPGSVNKHGHHRQLFYWLVDF
jgi:hypothetical protein